jgi:diguanylate cyclase (GGDEF)-like protein
LEGRVALSSATAERTIREPETRLSRDRPIAVHELSDASRRRAHQLIQTLGYRLASESSPEELLRRAAGQDPPGVLLAAMPEGRELVEQLLALPRPPVVVASLAGPATTAQQRFAEIQADLYAVRPHSLESLGPALHAATVLAEQRGELGAARAATERLRQQLHQVGHSGDVTGFQHFEYFKKLLVLEIKRAKRFGYSIAVCLVAPDPWEEDEEPSEEIQRKLRHKAARAIISCIRDIDIPVDYADDRMLLFLPYTDVDGAREVGERVAGAVARAAHTREGDRAVKLTVSCGIAALREGKPISFARLIKDSTAALKAAQLKGGRRVVVRS